MISKSKIKKRAERKENPALQELIMLLRKQKKPFWIEIAALLARAKRKSVAVNIEKINKFSKPNDTVVVPGKLLGKGSLDHNVRAACFSASEEARNKCKNIISIQELLKENPSGKNVRIII